MSFRPCGGLLMWNIWRKCFIFWLFNGDPTTGREEELTENISVLKEKENKYDEL